MAEELLTISPIQWATFVVLTPLFAWRAVRWWQRRRERAQTRELALRRMERLQRQDPARTCP